MTVVGLAGVAKLEEFKRPSSSSVPTLPKLWTGEQKNPRFPGNSKQQSSDVAGLGVRRTQLCRCGRDELARIVPRERIGIFASGKRKK
jgi:hypothetical protein